MKQRNNSVIYRDVNEDEYIDLSSNGSYGENSVIELTEQDNGFILGDAIYYDFNTRHYRRALAINQIMSEVIGVVSRILDKDTFELTLKGIIILDRYKNIPAQTPLFLSPNISGKLIPDEPNIISKIIGITTASGLEVAIQRGYYLKDITQPDPEEITTLRYYTQQEIQDLVTRIKNDIY